MQEWHYMDMYVSINTLHTFQLKDMTEASTDILCPAGLLFLCFSMEN